ADNFCQRHPCATRWAHVLRPELQESFPTRCRNGRQDSARDEAPRYSDRAADQVRSCHQSEDRQGTWPDHFANAARHRQRGDRVRRREFIAFVGGAVAAWPLAAGAQSGRLRLVGILMPLSSGDPEAQARVAAFLQAMAELGWNDGRNVRIAYRW